MTDKKSSRPSWADLFISAAGFGGVGMLAAAVMNSDQFKPMTRERLLGLFDEHAYFETKASRLDREALTLWCLQLEHVARGESSPVELDLRALETYRAARDAKADASRKFEDLERGKALLLAQLLDERRRSRAKESALRILSLLFRKCGRVKDEAIGRDEALEAIAARSGSTRGEAEALLDAVVSAVETVLRSGVVTDEEWPFFEETLPMIDGECLEWRWKYEKSIHRLDEALVRAVRPLWREGQYSDMSAADKLGKRETGNGEPSS